MTTAKQKSIRKGAAKRNPRKRLTVRRIHRSIRRESYVPDLTEKQWEQIARNMKRKAKARAKSRKNPVRGSGPGDKVAAHELFLFAVNDADLYRQRIVPIIQNLQRKITKGVFDQTKSWKLWRYAADDAAKRYTHGGYGHGKGYGIFNVSTRELTAKELAAHYAEEVYERHARKNPRQRAFLHVERPRVVKRAMFKVYTAVSKYPGKWTMIAESHSKQQAINIGKHWHGKTRQAVKVVNGILAEKSKMPFEENMKVAIKNNPRQRAFFHVERPRVIHRKLYCIQMQTPINKKWHTFSDRFKTPASAIEAAKKMHKVTHCPMKVVSVKE